MSFIQCSVRMFRALDENGVIQAQFLPSMWITSRFVGLIVAWILSDENALYSLQYINAYLQI